jgi:UDP-N-acetylmuramate dehydrogenase
MIEKFELFLEEHHLTCVEKAVSLKSLTTIKCGGEADYLVEPDNYDDLSNIFKFICENKIPYQILGNGSNILVSDLGFPGIIISLKNLPYLIELHDGKLSVAAHIECVNLQKKCILEGLSGLEFLSGIPGTVGGIIAMNAGAFGRDIESAIDSIKVVTHQGNIVSIQAENIEFSYRKIKLSIEQFIIIEGTFKVQKKNMQEVKELCDSYFSQRKSKNLWQTLTFGSTFKNGTDYYAGELIEKCGLKGYSIGDAHISQNHANFIINNGNASSKDVYLLIQKMKDEVKKKFGKDLELEVKLWGDFSYAGK